MHREKAIGIHARKPALRGKLNDLGPMIDGNALACFPRAHGAERSGNGLGQLADASELINQGRNIRAHRANLHNADYKSSDQKSDLQINVLQTASMQRDADPDTKAGRLRIARSRRGYSTAKAAAESMGVPYGTYSGHEAGSRGIKDDDLERYARFFRVPVEWIGYGRGAIEDGGSDVYTVGVVGTIAAGGMIESSTEQPHEAEPLFEIEVPFPVPSDAFALQIKGDSMWPRYDDGDVIICHRFSQDPAPLVGWEAAIGTPEGNRYLKKLMVGSREGLFTLESHNASPIRDVQVAWASEVYGLVRAARWRKLDDKAKRREIRKAVA